MSNRAPVLNIASSLALSLGLLLIAGCSKLDTLEQQTSKTQEHLAQIEARLDQAGASGRYQIVVANQSDHGSVLFLVDTRGGQSWIYRPPQGPAINGFWSDIPKLSHSDEYWQRTFSPDVPAPAAQAAPAAPAPAKN